jgi:hypothetical protein
MRRLGGAAQLLADDLGGAVEARRGRRANRVERQSLDQVAHYEIRLN